MIQKLHNDCLLIQSLPASSISSALCSLDFSILGRRRPRALPSIARLVRQQSTFGAAAAANTVLRATPCESLARLCSLPLHCFCCKVSCLVGVALVGALKAALGAQSFVIDPIIFVFVPAEQARDCARARLSLTVAPAPVPTQLARVCCLPSVGVAAPTFIVGVGGCATQYNAASREPEREQITSDKPQPGIDCVLIDEHDSSAAAAAATTKAATTAAAAVEASQPGRWRWRCGGHKLSCCNLHIGSLMTDDLRAQGRRLTSGEKCKSSLSTVGTGRAFSFSFSFVRFRLFALALIGPQTSEWVRLELGQIACSLLALVFVSCARRPIPMPMRTERRRRRRN